MPSPVSVRVEIKQLRWVSFALGVTIWLLRLGLSRLAESWYRATVPNPVPVRIRIADGPWETHRIPFPEVFPRKVV